MSKTRYSEPAPAVLRLGEWLRQLREERELPLRAVADEADMDLTHLHKIELGLRLPTEEQTTKLARFFRLDQTDTQARRIAEKFRMDYEDNPAAAEALQMLQEQVVMFGARRNGRATKTN